MAEDVLIPDPNHYKTKAARDRVQIMFDNGNKQVKMVYSPSLKPYIPTVHTLKLHEGMGVSPLTSAMRVPGGWIYTTLYTKKGMKETLMSSVFVPFAEPGLDYRQ